MAVTPSDCSMPNCVIGRYGAVQAHQRNVGPVQRGDDGQIAAARGLLLRLRHLARQQRGDGVRNGVVDVQQIERVELRDLGHARGQRQVVGRMLEERVVVDIHLVEEDVGFAAAQPERQRRGDEVDLVAARRQLNAKLRGNHARAAIGGVTGDADLAAGRSAAGRCRCKRHKPLRVRG